MNLIADKQNSPLNLTRLEAQRHLYSRAKTILLWQMLLGGPVAVALAFFGPHFPAIKVLAALWGILVAIADVVWLMRLQKRWRTLAAQIQEQFDCDVLQLPWNDVKAGKEPIPEVVEEAAEQYRAQNGVTSLLNWYSPQVSQVPIHVARIICQRQNCWWDSNQRRKYAAVVVVLVLGVFLGVLAVSIPQGITLERFLVAVLFPLLPALLIGYRQFNEQLEAATRLDDLREHAERLWAEVLTGLSAETATTQARRLQDEILEHRKRSPLVFDYVFELLRAKHQTLANRTTDQYIAEARQRLELGSNP